MTAPVERPQRTPPDSGGGLSGKIGPLPTWAWLGIAAVGGIVVILYLRSRSSAASSTQNTGSVAPSTADVANLQDQLATVTSQIRDLQGAPSTPQGNGSGRPYLFRIPGDPNGPGSIYIGIPGSGYYWAPNPDILAQFEKVKQPVDLGTITAAEAQTRFGTQKPWSMIGQGPSQ